MIAIIFYAWIIIMSSYYVAVILTNPQVLLQVTPTSMIKAYIYTLLLPIAYVYLLLGYNIVSTKNITIIIDREDSFNEKENKS